MKGKKVVKPTITKVKCDSKQFMAVASCHCSA